eukprot:4135880-Heterocapsa_arctica.AAC.1
MRRAVPPCFTESTLRRRLNIGTRSRKPRTTNNQTGCQGQTTFRGRGAFQGGPGDGWWDHGPRQGPTSD